MLRSLFSHKLHIKYFVPCLEVEKGKGKLVSENFLNVFSFQ